MSEFVERYRRNAERCLQLVQSFNDPEARRSLLAMANAWLMLAAQRERTVETAPAAHEPTPSINEPPPPPDEPQTPPPIDEPKPPPVKEPPPVSDPPQHLDAAEPDDSMQS